MIYLCGGINGLSDADCKDWREQVKDALGECLDPMRRDYRGIEDQHVDAIVAGDLKDIQSCSAVLVNANKPSWGTAMEMVYAHQQNKLIVTVAEGRISPWLRYHSSVICGTFQEAIEYLQRRQK